MSENNNTGIVNQTVAWIKAQDPARFGSFCLAKFNAGFTAVEKAVRVTNGDIRDHEELGEDAACQVIGARPPPVFSRASTAANQRHRHDVTVG